MKILITGATGFIGSHLIDALIRKGEEIRCIVRRESNIENLKRYENNIELFYADLLNDESLKKALEGVFCVYHLAGIVYSKNIYDFYRVNYEGAFNLFNKCMDAKVKKFIFLSSLAAVGPISKYTEFDESVVPSPITHYGKSKWLAEKYILTRSKDVPFLSAIIIRAPLIYGLGMDRRSRLYGILKMARRGFIFQVGNSHNKIPLCHIENIIDILIKAKKAEDKQEIYFIKDKKDYTIDNIKETLEKVLKRKIRKIWIPEKLKFILKILPVNKDLVKELGYSWDVNIKKLERDFGYNSTKEFKDAVSGILKYYGLL